MSNPSLLYTIVDAFTSTPFSGNPASVIILPPSHHSLPTESLLQIAAEFNLSETAFLIPKTSTSPSTLRYGLRWFTPAVEVPLCGHATLASARVIFSTPEGQQVDKLEFETLSGTLVASKVPGGSGKIELDFPASVLEELASVDELAQVSEVVSAAVGGGVSVRAVRNAGFFLLVEVDPGFDLEGAVVDASQFLKLRFDAIIVTSSRPSSFRPNARFMSRMFAPRAGVAEDPVCGSAHCALAPYWSQVLDIPPGVVIEVRQASKRGGDLDVIWEKESGKVRIQGSAVVTMRGELYL
ncbi:hypothetical protein FRC04_003390 [Tulasnella sp. 424]|nr:hypothetical protein FRC04_003390 [Tulasnella sp. 424]KAG8977204.1 hypothetical protein FRC05_002203 [Tulasnella sp. 425]